MSNNNKEQPKVTTDLTDLDLGDKYGAACALWIPQAARWSKKVGRVP